VLKATIHGEVLRFEFVVRHASDTHQLLDLGCAADRNDEAAADFHLLLEGFGHLRSSGRHHNGIERRLFRPAAGSVGVPNLDIVIAESCQRRCGALCQFSDALDAVNAGGYLREDRGGVAGSCADLENSFSTPQIQGFDHERNDVGLGDGLPCGYGQG
jgi:hypothetical protein